MGVKLVSDIKGRNRLRVFENRVLRRIFAAQRDEVMGAVLYFIPSTRYS
jgi:hypothetical protein